MPAGGADCAGGTILFVSIGISVGVAAPAGAGAGVIWIGACTGPLGATGIAFCGAVSNTVVPSPAFRVARIDNESEVTMNSTADTVVAFDNSVAEPRGPKAVCEPIPPKAPAKSAAFPLCSRTTMIKNTHTIT